MLRAALLAAAINLLVAGVLGWHLRGSWLRGTQQGAVTSENLALLLEHTLAAVFDKVDLALIAVADERQHQLAEGRLDEARLAQVIARQKTLTPDLATLRIADAAGRVYLGQPDNAAGLRVDDRDYFLELRAPREGMFISRPWNGKLLKVPVILCARRLAHADGSFAGVVFGALTLEHLGRLLGEIDVGPRGAIVLRDERLLAVVRKGLGGIELAPQVKTTGELEAIVASGRTQASYQAAPVVDGILRSYAFRKLQGRPLYVIVGVAVDDALAGFWHDVRQAIVSVVLVALFTVLVGLSMLRWLGRDQESALLRERALQSLRESEARLQATFAVFPDALAITRSDTGRYELINDGFVKVSGWPRELVVGRTAAELGVWTDLRDREAIIGGVSRNGFVDDHEATFRRRDGTTFTGLMSARLFTLEGERLLLTVTRDITRQRQLEAQLQQAQRLESVGRLAGGVAHDFNNMLLVILGEAAILEEALPADHPERQSVEEILRAANRSRELTRQLLAFSRKQVISPQVVDLNRAIDGTRQALGRLIGADVALSFEPQPEVWPVRIDPSQLDQVLINLVVNARDAMPDGGRLSISTRNVKAGEGGPQQPPELSGADSVAMSVRDSGTGMTPEVLAHLFEPFFTTKGPGKGTGLGLATIYGIVRQSGGAVAVESAPRQGSVFTVWLPRAPPEPEGQAGAAAASEPQRARGAGAVLLVEDEAAVRRTTQKMLESLGYTVVAAADAAEALALEAHGSAIDLLATDVVMPGMKGTELAAEMLRRRPGLRTLLLSGYAASVLGEGAHLSAGTHFLQKPFTIDDLARAVREALGAMQ
jgi:two-component system, cell cycle sensor histidine kinase and response regulator CckA